jgi:hypothetical protein
MTTDEIFHEHLQQVLFCKNWIKEIVYKKFMLFIMNNLSHEMPKLYLN